MHIGNKFYITTVLRCVSVYFLFLHSWYKVVFQDSTDHLWRKKKLLIQGNSVILRFELSQFRIFFLRTPCLPLHTHKHTQLPREGLKCEEIPGLQSLLCIHADLLIWKIPINLWSSVLISLQMEQHVLGLLYPPAHTVPAATPLCSACLSLFSLPLGQNPWVWDKSSQPRPEVGNLGPGAQLAHCLFLLIKFCGDPVMSIHLHFVLNCFHSQRQS